jgi:putative ABC transport system ATP-binding protein
MVQGQLIVETHNLVKVYGDGAEVRALDGIDLRVGRGSFVSVMGPSGSGKSTLLNMLGALDRPTEGEAFVDGENLATVADLDSFRARTVGFVFQLHNLIPTLTSRENVEVPMRGQPVDVRQRRERAVELLGLVGLGHRMDHLPSQLSGGERQRVAIARSLANRPVLVLADEPTGDLDTQAGADVMALLGRLNRELGTTIIVVTHDPAVARETERILVMRDGRIVHEHVVGTPFEEDLAAFRRSGLGKAIVVGDREALAAFGAHERAALKTLLAGGRLADTVDKEEQVSEIEIEKNPDEERLNELGVREWPTWSKDVSEFPWSYEEAETCYVLEGQVQVKPDGGAPVEIGAGDLVTFPKGLSCTWKVTSPIRKHYRLG